MEGSQADCKLLGASEGVWVGWVTINILYQGGCLEGPNLRHFNPWSSVQKPYRGLLTFKQYRAKSGGLSQSKSNGG